MDEAQLHPDVVPFGTLVGIWRGRGDGTYPTIDDFGYTEEVTFSAVPGKPFLVYGQRTRAEDDGRPLHTESGFWRAIGGGAVEVVLAHPTGIVERLLGRLDDGVIDLVDDAVTTTPTAKSVTATRRRFAIDGDVLEYTMAMAAVGHPVTHHLSARLERVTGSDS